MALRRAASSDAMQIFDNFLGRIVTFAAAATKLPMTLQSRFCVTVEK